MAALVACVGAAFVARGGARRQPVRAVSRQAFASQPMPAHFAFAGASKPSKGEETETSRIPRRMLMPKNIRYRKPMKPRVKPLGTMRCSNYWKYRGDATKQTIPEFGKYGLATKSEAWINGKNIEQCRRMAVRSMRKDGGKVWIRIFPHSGLTKRAAESRMGGGKGALDTWVAVVQPKFVLFEVDGCEREIAVKIFWKMSRYLPFGTKFIERPPEMGPSRFEMGMAGDMGGKKRHIPEKYQPKT